MRLMVTDGVLDLERGEVVRDVAAHRLTPAERELLGYLAARAGRDVSRNELHERVWGHGVTVVSRAADFTVHRLRKKIEADPEHPRHLITVAGGYRWVPAERAVEGSDTVVLVVGEPAVPGDGAWLAGCAAVVRTTGVALVDLAPDRVVVAASDAVGALDAARALAALAPIRLGVACGPAERLVDPFSGRTMYGGAALANAVALARAARPGDLPDAPFDGAEPPAAAAMPLRADRFVGRAGELADLEARLAGGARVLAIVGPAGAGKSRLAEEVVARTGRPGLLVRLDAVDTLDDVVAAVARAVGLSGPPSAGSVGAALAQRGAVCLVLDGAERVAERLGDLVTAWLALAHLVRVVVTSRDRGTLPGAPLVLAGLDEDDALALIVDRCPEVAASAGVRSLVRSLDGLPLALELIAPRLRIVRAELLSARLDRVLAAVVAPGNALDRALSASWDRLDPSDRRLVARATVFPGPFDLGAAEAVLTDDDPTAPWLVDGLRVAADRHWIEVDPATGRYRLLAAIRAFAAARDAGMVSDAALRHARWFARLGDRIPRYGPPPFSSEVLPDLYVAAETAIGVGPDPAWAPVARDIARTIGVLSLLAAAPEPALEVIARVVAVHPDIEPQLTNAWSRLATRAGRSTEAVAVTGREVERARRSGDPDREGRAEHLLATALRRAGRPDEALAALGRAESRLIDPSERGVVQHTRAALLIEAGRFAPATAAIERLEGLGTPRFARIAEELRSVVEVLTGDLDAAIPRLVRMIDRDRAEGDRFGVVNHGLSLAVAVGATGATADARSRFRALMAEIDALGSTTYAVGVAAYQAAFALEVGDLVEATAVLDRTASAAAAIEDLRLAASWWSTRAEERAATGRLEEAAMALARAEAALAGCPDPVLSGHLAVHRGMVAWHGRDPEAARRALADAEGRLRELELRPTAPLAVDVRRLRRAIGRG